MADRVSLIKCIRVLRVQLLRRRIMAVLLRYRPAKAKMVEEGVIAIPRDL